MHFLYFLKQGIQCFSSEPFPLREQSPTITVTRFFFVRQQNACVVDTFCSFEVFGTMRISKFSFFCFYRKFFNVSKVSPFEFFDILQQTGFSKSPKGPSFTILKTLGFLSLRYCADFRRSRLVLKQDARGPAGYFPLQII